MANSQTPAAGAELSGNVMFYNKPEPLNPQVHGALGVNFTDRPFSFVTKTHVVPITVTEFAPCSLSYPVVFVGENKTPLCVMGLRDGENLFVSEDGVFRPDVYIPAFVRRYPFVFAADDKGERFVLCVDRSASFISENAEIPFFEDGLARAIRDNAACAPSGSTPTKVSFVMEIDFPRKRTNLFVGKSSTIKKEKGKELLRCVSRGMPTPDWGTIVHQYSRYKVNVTATYPPRDTF